MAVEHNLCPVYGVQFHPESILTPEGRKILENFFKIEIRIENRGFENKDIALMKTETGKTSIKIKG